MELVGRYEIERQIGEGAMADVYRAHDPSIDRVVAIKVLKSEFRQNHDIAHRFLREARAAGALSHPGIVTIYDVGEADGFPYIAMEFLEGEPLDEVIAREGALPLKRVVEIGQQLASALDYAHGLGIVHRDIKPSNIMLCDGGRSAKILDFGIARIGEEDRVRAELNMLRTQVGQVLGTPRYMSPEQALGLEIGHRSDLFSLGVVLYEMLTGKTAFGGTSFATVALQITQQKPEPIDTLAADCPRGLQFIVDKLLAKQPDKRFTSGAEIAAALKREEEVLSAETGAKKRRLPLQAKLTLLMSGATAAALLVSIGTVLERQYDSMERMALTSGTSISSFVANNVALRAVENASLPEVHQDWLPVQAFIASASSDPNVRQIVMTDARGIVRGATDPTLIGRSYRGGAGEELVQSAADQRVTEAGRAGFRFERTIRYAGQPFGKVDLVVSKDQLVAASQSSRDLLIGLGLAILLVVVGISYTTARLLLRPIRRLGEALADAAAGKLDFRISHSRKDEFGELFDRFNDLAASLEDQAETDTAPEPSLDDTRVDLVPLQPIRRRA